MGTSGVLSFLGYGCQGYAYRFDDLVDVVGEERGPLAVARVDVLVHDLHAVE